MIQNLDHSLFSNGAQTGRTLNTMRAKRSPRGYKMIEDTQKSIELFSNGNVSLQTTYTRPKVYKTSERIKILAMARP